MRKTIENKEMREKRIETIRKTTESIRNTI